MQVSWPVLEAMPNAQPLTSDPASLPCRLPSQDHQGRPILCHHDQHLRVWQKLLPEAQPGPASPPLRTVQEAASQVPFLSSRGGVGQGLLSCPSIPSPRIGCPSGPPRPLSVTAPLLSPKIIPSSHPKFKTKSTPLPFLPLCLLVLGCLLKPGSPPRPSLAPVNP